MSRLTADQVALQLQELKGWTLDANSLVKTFEFTDFASVVSFITHIAFYCEKLEHHPRLEVIYNVLTVQIGDTQQADIHSRDIQLAKRIESCFNS